MRATLTIAAILFASTCCYAQGAKSCDDLKTEIAAKLDAKNVKGYSLDIVDKDKDAGDGKVVGTCEAGAKKIVYSRTAAASPSPKDEPAKP